MLGVRIGLNKPSKKSFLKRLWKDKGLLALAFPGVAFIVLFSYVPLYGLILPFKNFRYDLGFFKSPWFGLQNFKFLFNSSDVLVATLNTLMYNIAFILIGTVAAITVAIMLFELSRKVTKIYQTIMFFPYFLSWVIVAYIIMALLDMSNGMFNVFRESRGLEGIMWYNVASYWPTILIVTAVWKGLGYGSVIYFAAIVGFNPEYYEAAAIEGASRFKRALYITLPLLKPLIVIMTMLQIGRIFYSDFGLFYYVPRNSPMIQTTISVIDTYVYKVLRVSGNIGMASAAGFYQAVVGFIFVLSMNFTIRKIDKESAVF